jgi:hypothetical protein
LVYTTKLSSLYLGQLIAKEIAEKKSFFPDTKPIKDVKESGIENCTFGGWNSCIKENLEVTGVFMRDIEIVVNKYALSIPSILESAKKCIANSIANLVSLFCANQ